MKDLSSLDMCIKEVEGIPLIMPNLLAELWPSKLSLDEFPDMCGAKEGFSELIIPDTFYFQSQRHNCFIHDVTHTILPPTPSSFHVSNTLLLVNCLNTISVKSVSKMLRFLRERRAITYYQGVETEIGLKCYMDREGGNVGQADYNPLFDLSFINKLKQVGVSV